MTLLLEFCSRSDPRYKETRDRHYIPNKGAHAQQIHFTVRDDDKVLGIISGGSSVYSVAARNEFFGIPSDKTERQSLWLPAIVNNTVFRLETHEKNLGTKTLSLWRNTTSKLWEDMYGVPVIGYETFIIEEPWRAGSMYLADNWTKVGITAGNTKQHVTGGLTESFTRVSVEKKLILCRWAKSPHKVQKPVHKYVSSWRASTDEEKQLAKKKAQIRKDLLGSEYRGS